MNALITFLFSLDIPKKVWYGVLLMKGVKNHAKEYFRYLTQQGIIVKNPMNSAPMIKNLINGQRQADGTIRALTPRQVADLLGHTTSQITELYYVKKDTARLNGITDAFEI